VGRFPSRMVPPLIVFEPSGIKTISGVESVVPSNSSELASNERECWFQTVRLRTAKTQQRLANPLWIPSTFLANSTTASCNPRQMPKKGMLCSRAHLIERIMPSIPRSPKPPGTMMPSAVQTAFQASWYLTGSFCLVGSSRSVASTHCGKELINFRCLNWTSSSANSRANSTSGCKTKKRVPAT